jgi:hypothetical protein
MTRFLPARIFSTSSRQSRSSSRYACQSFRGPNGHSKAWRRLVGMRKGGSWLEKAAGRVFGNSRVGAARPFPFILSFSFPFRSLDPTSTFPALLLRSCYPGLRFTRRFRLRAPRVSIFPSLPFISALNGRNVLIWLFSFLCLFVFFL